MCSQRVCTAGGGGGVGGGKGDMPGTLMGALVACPWWHPRPAESGHHAPPPSPLHALHPAGLVTQATAAVTLVFLMATTFGFASLPDALRVPLAERQV